MTFQIRTERLLALAAEVQRPGSTFASLHAYSQEIASVENQILNCRAFALTYRLDEQAEAHLDPSIVHV